MRAIYNQRGELQAIVQDGDEIAALLDRMAMPSGAPAPDREDAPACARDLAAFPPSPFLMRMPS